MKTHRTGIVVFLFGVPGKILPNTILKGIAEEISQSEKAPIFSQRGIFFGFGIDVEYANGNDESPTLQIADQAAEWAWRKSLNEIIVVAASPHAKRCVRDINVSMKEKNIPPITISICAESILYNGFWFSKKSKQLRTRSPFFWRPREWVLEKLPFPIYKLVAG